MEGYDDYGFGDYSYAEAEPSPTSGGNVFSDFFNTARDRVQNALTPMQTTEQGPSVGSQIFEAIYQYGAGKIDVAREKAVGAFLMTSEGKKAQKVGIQQTLMQYAPLLLIAIIGIFALGMFSRR